MATFFLKIYGFFNGRRRLFFALMVLLTATGVYLGSRVHFREDITDFIPRGKDVERFTGMMDRLKNNDRLMIIVSNIADSGGAAADMASYADVLAGAIEKELKPEYVRNITCRLSAGGMQQTWDVVWRNLPFFLEGEDYQTIRRMLSPGHVDTAVAGIYRILVSPAGAMVRESVTRDPLGFTRLGVFRLTAGQAGNEYQVISDHLFSADGRHLLMFVSSAHPASETAANAELIRKLDEIIASTEALRGAQLEVNYYGGVAVSAANASRLKKDSLVTMLAAVVILFAFFTWFFRRKRILLFLMLPVVFGAVFSLGLVYLLRPEISVIAIGAGSIILGIAINYSIHFYAHYRHSSSVREVIADLAGPLTIGSLTTIGAFLGLLFVRSRALNDFGMVSAFCLLGSVLFTLVALPFLVPRIKPGEREGRQNIIDRISALRPDRNKWIMAVIGILTAFFLYKAGDVQFESDWNKLNYLTPGLKKAEDILNRISDSALRPVYLVSTGKNREEALRNSERADLSIQGLKNCKLISQVHSTSGCVFSDSLCLLKARRWNEFWTPGKIDSLKDAFRPVMEQYQFSKDAFNPFFSFLTRTFGVMDPDDAGWLAGNYAPDLSGSDSNGYYVIASMRINPDDREAVMKMLPDDAVHTVIDRQHLSARFSDIISLDFNLILLISSVLVFSFLLLTYGRIELALTAFAPMLISWIWILGLMSLLGIKFNVISIIISAFIFGLGDDYSIFIMDGLIREYKTGKKLLPSYKTAVILSAFTTLVGVGVLIFARHPALRSIALLTIIGMVSVVFISYTVAPAVFGILVRSGGKQRLFPATLGGFIYAVVCYSWFLTGCFLTALFGLTIFRFLPLPRKKRKLVFHYMLMYVCRTTMYLMYLTRKRFINLTRETFSTPSVIIVNHQSMIDIPFVLMFNPRVLVVTNDKWYNAKLIGIVIKLAGYLPATLGYDEIADRYRDYIRDGYSIIVFPEGSRSANQRIHRFHKGAFYMAEKLNLPILPMLIHGTGSYVAKGTLLGRRSLVTTRFLDRIMPGDASFGTGYKERTLRIQNYFRAQFEELLKDYRDPRLQYDLMVRNFVYKGPVVEWYTRIKIRLENYYREYQALIPMNAKILDIGCGYGYLGIMLGRISSDRRITGIDYDEEKVLMAQHCASRPENVGFLHRDVLNYNLDSQDVIVMNDVMHYLPQDRQEDLLNRCILCLNPGGMILLRDGDSQLHQRHRGTKLTEFFSTRSGFNKTTVQGLSFLSGGMVRRVAAEHGLSLATSDSTRFTSNVLFILRKPKISVNSQL